MATGYSGYSSVEMKTPHTDTPETPSYRKEKTTEFYSSGIGLTFCQYQRSWIDPWEHHPNRWHDNDGNDNNSKTTPYGTSLSPNNSLFQSTANIATAIEPLKYQHLSSSNVMSETANGEEYNMSSSIKVDDDTTKLIGDSKKTPNGISKQSKFGPWDGVMAGCLLNIFGVIMFLRVGWIVGQAGILQTIVIMSISTLVTTLTSLSMSAICTNGVIKAGGAYYIISRTLGPAFGGSVGILLSFGNMVACSMYLVGFAETLVDNLRGEANGFSITGNDVHDIRIWSNIILILVLFLALIGLKYVIKAQIGLLIFISFSIITFFIGSFYQTEENVLYGLKGWVNGNFTENLTDNYVDGYDFWTVLAIFFPAVTGIMAGANISGDLKDPSKAIPQGTLTAVVISSIVYMVMAIFVGAVAARTALIDNTLIMADICVWDYIVFIGVYAATLSSAIASLVGAPRILMAIADDNIIAIPGISYFAKTDKDGNPIRGYFISFGVAFMFNCIGELNLIAPLISQFFIIVYLIINFACFVMEISHSPGWRPSFKYFSRYTGLLGSILCLTVMFLLNLWYALSTVCIAFSLYLFISWKDPGVSWGGAFDSRSLYSAYQSVLNLGLNKKKRIGETITMDWRPSFLLLHLVGISNNDNDDNNNDDNNNDDNNNDGLTYFVETLRKGHSLIFAVQIEIGDFRTNLLNNLTFIGNDNNNNDDGSGYLPVRQHQSSRTHFVGKRVNGFCNKIISESYRNGVQCALQMTGLGMLKPNTLIMDMPNLNNIDVTEYVEILRDTLLNGCGIMICCGFETKINWICPNYKFNNNIIDIWWLVDDGGLILLLPYIMRLHTFWSECRVRINVVTDDNQYSSTWYEENKIKQLIEKFRLPYTDEPRIIRVENNKISNKTLNKFENYANTKIHDTIRQKVIRRWLRLSELLIEYSKNSALILVTLPVPTTFITPKQYISILNIMSDQKQLPPTIIMRGNGQQTLTFHSE